MADAAQQSMDVDGFLAWAEGREGRWELRDGQPVSVAPERAIYALTKYAAQKALEAGIGRAGLPCRMFPDGMTVRIAARTAFEPDALVVCPPPPLDAVEIANPVVVVEVLSPGTAADDHGLKLDGYFSLPGVDRGPPRRTALRASLRATPLSPFGRGAGGEGPGRLPARSPRDSGAVSSSAASRRLLPTGEGEAFRPRRRRDDGVCQQSHPTAAQDDQTPARLAAFLDRLAAIAGRDPPAVASADSSGSARYCLANRD